MGKNCLFADYIYLNILKLVEDDDTKVEVKETKVLIANSLLSEDISKTKDEQDLGLSWIFEKSVNELADEIIQFAKDEIPSGELDQYPSFEIQRVYWSSKGVDLRKADLPLNLRSITEKSGLLAETKYKEEQANKILKQSDIEIAEDIIRFAKEDKLIKENEGFLHHEIERVYWLSKGIDTTKFGLASNLKLTMKKSWLLADKIYREEIEKEKQKQEPTSVNNLSDEDEFLKAARFQIKRESKNENEIFSKPVDGLADELISFCKKINVDLNTGDLFDWQSINLFWRSKKLGLGTELSVDGEITKRQVENTAKKKYFQSILEGKEDTLSKELAEFAKKRSNTVEGKRVDVSHHSYSFWKGKGLESVFDFPEIEQKKDDIEIDAQAIAGKEYEELITKQTENETQMLPGLITNLVDWATKLQKKRVSLKEVDYFLQQNKLVLSKTTSRVLYVETNNKLSGLNWLNYKP